MALYLKKNLKSVVMVEKSMKKIKDRLADRQTKGQIGIGRKMIIIMLQFIVIIHVVVLFIQVLLTFASSKWQCFVF